MDYLYVNPKTDCSELTDDSQVSFVPMPNVQEKNNMVSYDLVPYNQVKKGFTVFKKGDLIWAKITPCMQNGKSCITDNMPTEIGFGSTEFHVIRQRRNDIYMPFIWSIFSNDDVLKAAQATFSGSAGQQRVPSSFIESFPAVVPEYGIQVAMVKHLEINLTAMNTKIKQANELLACMNDFILPILNITMPEYEIKLCSGVKLLDIKNDNTLSADYYHPERMATIHMIKSSTALMTKRLSEVIEFHRDIVDSSKSDFVYLGLAGVESGTGELNGNVESAAGQAFVYQKGDVLYGRLRPYLNKVLYTERDGICSTEFHVMRILDEKTVLPEYLAAIMRTNIILSQTRHMMTGNTHPRISNDDVKNLYIPVPPMAIQRDIVKEVQFRRQKARKLKQQAEQEWAEAKAKFERELLGE